MRNHRQLLLLSTVGLLAAAYGHADTLTIPIGAQAGQNGNLPQRGDDQQAVIASHGNPARRSAAIGEPPISRWEYAGFAVIFENGQVVHSVTKHQSTPDGQTVPAPAP